MNFEIQKFVDKHYAMLIYCFALILYSMLLYNIRSFGLLPMPIEGTDQKVMLFTAADLYKMKLPESVYRFSPGYTVFLTGLIAVAQGNLVVMRFLQAAVCAMIPVMIYWLGLRLRIGRDKARLGALIYCFYGPASLITLDFLREAPLALCFISYVYFLLRAATSRKTFYFALAGIFAGLCVLGRENFIPIVLLPSAVLIFRKFRTGIRMKQVFAYLLALALLVSPVIMYNLVRFNSPAIIPGNLKNVLSFYYGDRVKEDNSFACEVIVKNIPSQIVKFCSSYEIPNSLSFYAHRDVADILWIFPVTFNLILALSIAVLWLYRRNKGVICVSIFILAYLMTMIYFEMFYRFRIPCVPLICVLAGASLGYMIRNVRQGRVIWTAVIVVLVFLLTYSNSDKKRSAQEKVAAAQVIIQTMQLGKAEAYIQKLDADGIDTRQLKAMFADYSKK
ncbi:MAG: glycosyltransferase family 39 protein [Victivallales bacterium]